jgi:septum formation protein
MRLVLASASPARLALLRAAGLDPEVTVSGIDEDAVTSSLGLRDPAAIVAGLARAKAESVAAELGTTPHDAALVIGCDSLLDLDGRPLGKPRDAAEAIARWKSMRGREGVLRTGHHVIRTGGGIRAGSWPAAHSVASTVVHFAELTDDEIAAYVATGEPLHVAGAFTIDGRGAAFVERIEGDHGTVVGLSLPLLRRLAGDLGVAWQELWADPLQA